MVAKDIINDVKTNAAEICGRELTEDELNENVQAMLDYYEMCLEDSEGNEVAAKDFFDETFYEHLKEILVDEQETVRVSFNVWCQAVYTTGLDVPKSLARKDREDELIAYIKAHLDKAPLGTLDYVQDSDDLDTESIELPEEDGE